MTQYLTKDALIKKYTFLVINKYIGTYFLSIYCNILFGPMFIDRNNIYKV